MRNSACYLHAYQNKVSLLFEISILLFASKILVGAYYFSSSNVLFILKISMFYHLMQVGFYFSLSISGFLSIFLFPFSSSYKLVSLPFYTILLQILCILFYLMSNFNISAVLNSIQWYSFVIIALIVSLTFISISSVFTTCPSSMNFITTTLQVARY